MGTISQNIEYRSVWAEVRQKYGRNAAEILVLIHTKSTIKQNELTEKLYIGLRTIQKTLQKLKKDYYKDRFNKKRLLENK